jgi:hypothetical protein
VCALIGAYRQRRARSRHLGCPGRAIDVHVRVERATTRSSRRYGQIVRYELIDRNVNRLVWFQTRGAELTAGQVVTLAGRVRAHEQHGRSKLTGLSHCRITDPTFSNPGPSGSD